MQGVFLFLFFVLFTVSPAGGALYQWEDDKGNVFFSDDFGKIPTPYQSRARKIQSSPKSSVSPRTPKSDKNPTFEQITDKRGNGKKWWQDLKKRWKRKQQSAEDKIKTLQLEIRQLTGHTMISDEARVKEAKRMKKQLKAAELKRDVAIRMLTEGLPKEAQSMGAPLSWLTDE